MKEPSWIKVIFWAVIALVASFTIVEVGFRAFTDKPRPAVERLIGKIACDDPNVSFKDNTIFYKHDGQSLVVDLTWQEVDLFNKVLWAKEKRVKEEHLNKLNEIFFPEEMEKKYGIRVGVGVE